MKKLTDIHTFFVFFELISKLTFHFKTSLSNRAFILESWY